MDIKSSTLTVSLWEPPSHCTNTEVPQELSDCLGPLVTCSFFRHSYITPHHIFHLWFKLCIIQFFQTVKMGHCSIWPHTHLFYTTKLGSTCLLMMPHRMNKSYKKIFFFFISHLLLLKFYICTSEADIRQL